MDAFLGSTPFIFGKKQSAVAAETHVLLVKFVDLGHETLHNGGQANGFLNSHRHIANPEFNRRVERVYAQIPPDFLGIVYGSGLDHQVNISVKFGHTAEIAGDSGTREFYKDLLAVRFEARLTAYPEGRVGRKRIHVRQEISHNVLDPYALFPVRNAYMNVKSEDKVGAGNISEVADDF